jgi:8-hydroxy-5-deazaflavin:NADPH oxidoreductase
LKIAILGGSGRFGKGLCFRWSKNHEIIIGSRDENKALQTAGSFAAEIQKFSIDRPIIGMSNREAVQKAEIIVLSLPFDHLLPLINEMKSFFDSKIVLSPVVPMIKKEVFLFAPPPEGSAALAIRSTLPASCRLVAALHTIPAARMKDPGKKLEGDVVVCGDDSESKTLIKNLVEEIEDLRFLDGGPLEVSRMVEPITPLILNLKLFGLKKDPAIKFV